MLVYMRYGDVIIFRYNLILQNRTEQGELISIILFVHNRNIHEIICLSFNLL